MSIPKQIPWEAIKKIALLGTDRSTIPEDLKSLMANLGTDLDQREDKIFLDGLSQMALLYRSARKFPRVNPIAKPDLLPIDQTPPPLEVSAMLNEILHGKYEPMLKEYLQCLAIRQWSFPPDQLPDFLNECLEQPELWQSVADHIGPTAHWLIDLNSAWRRLKSTPQKRDWLSKFPADRLRYFDKLRIHNPEEALTLLAEDWPQLKPKAKVAFLTIMSNNPTPLDLEFIQQLTPNKNRKINLAIFKIKSQFENIPLSDSAIFFLQNNIKGKQKLKVELPTTEDAQDLKLISQHPDFSGGLRANYLAQIIFLAPLSFFEKRLNKTAKEIIPLFLKNEWADVIIQALLHKSILTKNQEWLEAIFKNYLDQPEVIRWKDTLIDTIYPLLEVETFEKLANYGFARGIKILDGENAFIELLTAYDRRWPKEVSFSFFKLVKMWLLKNPRYWEGWYIWQIFRKAAFKIDPREFAIYHKAFSSDPLWALAEEEIRNLLEILKFRFRLYKKYP